MQHLAQINIARLRYPEGDVDLGQMLHVRPFLATPRLPEARS